MTTVRRLTQYVPLTREEFRRRFFERFFGRLGQELGHRILDNRRAHEHLNPLRLDPVKVSEGFRR